MGKTNEVLLCYVEPNLVYILAETAWYQLIQNSDSVPLSSFSTFWSHAPQDPTSNILLSLNVLNDLLESVIEFFLAGAVEAI